MLIKKIIFNKDKPRGVMHRRVDTTFLNSLYKKKFTELEHGIKITINWFVKNFNKINLKSKS